MITDDSTSKATKAYASTVVQGTDNFPKVFIYLPGTCIIIVYTSCKSGTNFQNPYHVIYGLDH